MCEMVSWRRCVVRCRGKSTVDRQLDWCPKDMGQCKCTEGYIANLAICAVGQSSDALKLEWRFVSK